MTYALTRSFSHASHGAGHAPSSHIATYVPVTGVPNPRPLKTRDLEAGTCMLDVIGPQTWVDGVGVTASSISNVCVLCELVLNCLNSEETTQLRRMATWEKGPTTEPRTRDLRPNAEFQPREPRSRSRSFVPHRHLCASRRLSGRGFGTPVTGT